MKYAYQVLDKEPASSINALTSNSYWVRKLGLFGSLLLLGFGALACESHHDGRPSGSKVTLVGKAYYPPQMNQANSVLANLPFQVLDFERVSGREVVAEGVTDGEGSYSIEINPSRIVAVIVDGKVRVSGLISADPNQYDLASLLSKDFDGITDIACEAGVSALQHGSVAAEEMDSERIANLEAAAQLIGATVNHLDPAAVSAAAVVVRSMTDNGDHPPVS